MLEFSKIKFWFSLRLVETDPTPNTPSRSAIFVFIPPILTSTGTKKFVVAVVRPPFPNVVIKKTDIATALIKKKQCYYFGAMNCNAFIVCMFP